MQFKNEVSKAQSPKVKGKSDGKRRKKLSTVKVEQLQQKSKKFKRKTRSKNCNIKDDSDSPFVEDKHLISTLQNNIEATTNNENSQTSKRTIPECGFHWGSSSVPENTAVSESSSDSEEEEQNERPKQRKKKVSAAERRKLEREKEREIREREETLANNEKPNSVDQFDRLVLSSPDSSLIWLQYMAYHLQATEIEKARAVVRRAIKTINFREENEKLNVWQAYLNLESRFGTTESLNEVFQEAIKTNDAIKIYAHMLTVHVDAGRQAELERVVGTVTRKFKQDPQAWIDCGAALLRMELKDKSRKVMQRALQSLPAQQHIDLMVRFAHLENKLGDKERAQTLFEQVLSSYPKRVDVWSSYVDALIKSGDTAIARKVLERATAQTLPARKMKTLFKKFISFEEQHGSPDGVARVQQMAVDYVENQCSK